MKKLNWLTFLLLLAALSYLREVLFLSINEVIAGESSFYAKTAKIDLFLHKDTAVLIQYKYIMTLGFTFAFALLSILGLRLSFQNKLPYYLSLLVYSLCFITAAFILLYAFTIGNFNSVYSFLRLIIEYLHNPLIYLILSASFLGYRYSQKQLLK